MTDPVLTCRGVVHDYEGSPALLGVDLDVHEGEVVAVTGPSGSGKSTLLLCLAGIIVPREGAVLLGGVDLRAVGERNRAALRRESVGVVFQYGTLVPELTAEENVALPLLLSGRSRADAFTAAERVVGAARRCVGGRDDGRPDEWRAAPTGRSGACLGHHTTGGVGRRTNGCAGFGGFRPRGHRAGRCCPRRRRCRRPGHPRRPGRGIRRPGGAPVGWTRRHADPSVGQWRTRRCSGERHPSVGRALWLARRRTPNDRLRLWGCLLSSAITAALLCSRLGSSRSGDLPITSTIQVVADPGTRGGAAFAVLLVALPALHLTGQT